jgi:hypothetical protein
LPPPELPPEPPELPPDELPPLDPPELPPLERPPEPPPPEFPPELPLLPELPPLDALPPLRRAAAVDIERFVVVRALVLRAPPVLLLLRAPPVELPLLAARVRLVAALRVPLLPALRVPVLRVPVLRVPVLPVPVLLLRVELRPLLAALRPPLLAALRVPLPADLRPPLLAADLRVPVPLVRPDDLVPVLLAARRVPDERLPPELEPLSSSDHLPDITRCAASATASAINAPSLPALDITLVAAWEALSAASIPASRILRRAAGLALIAAAAAARPAPSISRLIATLAILSTVDVPELEEPRPDDLDELRDDLEELFFVLDFAIAKPPCVTGERHFSGVTVPVEQQTSNQCERLNSAAQRIFQRKFERQ